MKTANQTLAISVRQPYAESIIRGEKVIEYRTTQTHVRGRVYIYAAKAREAAPIFSAYHIDSAEVSYGKIIGTIEIISSEKSYEFPEWYEWELSNPIKFEEPLEPINQPLPVFWYPVFDLQEFSSKK